MLPSLRLLIAAMLATVVVLMCGFGVFASFRISHDPIAHLPAAAAPSQLFADTEAAVSTVAAAGEDVSQHFEFDVPTAASGQPAPEAPIAEQDAAAEFAGDERPVAVPSGATKDAEWRADRDAHNVFAVGAAIPPELPAPASLPVGQWASSADTASDFSPPQPPELEEKPSTAITDKAIDATAATPIVTTENALGGRQIYANAPSGKTLAGLSPETEPAAGAHPAVAPPPDDRRSRGEPERRPSPAAGRDHQGRTAPHRTASAQAECCRHGQAETIARRRRQDGARRTVYRSVLHTLCAERPAGLRLRTRRVDRPGGCRCQAGSSASCRKLGGEKGQLGRRRTFCGAQAVISRLTGSPTAPTLRL
jgi:hypothetical protein